MRGDVNANVLRNNLIANDSVLDHARASGEISVGAAANNTPYTIESYSSRGPVTIRYPTNENRNKPDITGVDRISVSGAGGFTTNFAGTCAAAPHIVGIAALLWSKDPSKTASEIRTAILNSADPRTDYNAFGSGLANASRAYYSLYPGPTITSITPSTGENIEPITISNLFGNNFEPNARVFLSRNSLPVINATNITVVSPTTIICTLNITDAEAGSWNLTVQNPDGQTGTLTNGFIVTPYICKTSSGRTYLKNGILYYYPECPPFVTAISPNTGVNTGSVSITNLTGANFITSATVNLTRTGQPNITATNVQVVSSSQITCTFPLTGKAAGQWNIVVTNPDGQSGILANGFTVTAANPGNTPFVIDPSAMNTFDGQYLKSRGYGWCDFGGVNNSYYKITLAGTSQFPTEFHLKKSFTTKAQFGILVQASNVRISGVDLSTAPNADQRPVNSITNIYAPLTLAETGAAGIKVSSGYTGVKLVDVNVVGQNVPAVHVDGSNLDIIGTNNPDPYLTTYSGSGINDNWGTTLTGKLNSGYGLGLLQQTTSRSSAVTITGDGGAGVNISGPFSGIELNGKTATLAISGNTIHINGAGTESGTGSDRNSEISAWGGSRVNVTATDSSITGQEYGIYGQGGAIINVSCPGCTLGPIVSSTAGRPYREQAQSAGKSGIVGGINGIFLTG
ncbi:S8 family serine peptidase [uncultured Methanospirillum sp.]|uniref:S8 family serine peptidase n=1 Tax=uncultured Methanospirillum sp. TaxID=262503 RepID=UPI002D1E3F79|nr:S8 family serine peptidase [uncultured Methanospirillum sp.]